MYNTPSLKVYKCWGGPTPFGGARLRIFISLCRGIPFSCLPGSFWRGSFCARWVSWSHIRYLRRALWGHYGHLVRAQCLPLPRKRVEFFLVKSRAGRWRDLFPTLSRARNHWGCSENLPRPRPRIRNLPRFFAGKPVTSTSIFLVCDLSEVGYKPRIPAKYPQQSETGSGSLFDGDFRCLHLLKCHQLNLCLALVVEKGTPTG